MMTQPAELQALRAVSARVGNDINLVPGAGAIVRSDIQPGAEAMLICLALVAERLPADTEISYLPAEEERALLDCDAEKYRKALTKYRKALTVGPVS